MATRAKRTMTGKPARGFLLGKFMPLHNGHLFLCDVARAHVENLTILLCSRQIEPIAGALRETWMKDALPRDVHVLHLTDDNVPQEPSEHPDFWRIWCDIIRRFHPEPIDVVFGSEPYVLRLAEELSAKPFIVDQERTVVPISASAIRADPAPHWHNIPPVVRSHYQNHVCLLGPESVGKTTLADKLAAIGGTKVIPEYGRSYDAAHRQGTGWRIEDFHRIAAGHIAYGTALAQLSGPLVIEDTDYIQTRVWARHLLPDTQYLNLPLGWRPADHYLLLAPSVPWIDDGTRYFGDQQTRQHFFNQLRDELIERALPYTIIDAPDWDARVKQAFEIISEKF